MEGKSSTQNAEIDRFFNVLPIDNIGLDASLKIFVTKFRKFAGEYEWNTKISHNAQNLVFLKKKFFFEEKLEFFQSFNIVKGGKFALEYESIDIVPYKCCFHLNC